PRSQRRARGALGAPRRGQPDRQAALPGVPPWAPTLRQLPGGDVRAPARDQEGDGPGDHVLSALPPPQHHDPGRPRGVGLWAAWAARVRADAAGGRARGLEDPARLAQAWPPLAPLFARAPCLRRTGPVSSGEPGRWRYPR